MQFQLPSNLQNELIFYDPVLKKLAQNTKKAGSSKKSKYPLGNPPLLIPVDVIKESFQQEAVDFINAAAAPNRHQEFKKPVGNVPNMEYVTQAIMYHYEGVWVAAWLPPKGKENDYIYGYTYCFKDTSANRNMLCYTIRNDLEHYTITQIARSVYQSRTQFVTKQNIIDGNDAQRWFYNAVRGYSQKSRNITTMVGHFTESLKKTIPTWSDGYGIFDRIKSTGNLFQLLNDSRDLDRNYWDKYEKDFEQPKEQWAASVTALLHMVDYDTNVPRYHQFYPFVRIRHILDKPFFRKWIQDKCNDINTKYQDETNDSMAAIRKPWLLIKELVAGIHYVHTIWGDAVPLDYYQTNIDNLMGIKSHNTPSQLTVEWLAKHMPVTSFFQIRCKYYLEQCSEQAVKNYSHHFEQRLGIYQFRFHAWEDTCNMLNQILSNDKIIDAPKRWRITEFHDHVQAEAWKIQNPNHKLPQDLFPSPVKVQHAEENWTFFQPIDTHQLAQWGRAVRNCVGNASNYAEGVRKKQHFIVLCLVEGAPTFTVQLKVSNGMMSVDQIASFANKALNQEEKTKYTEAFSKALQERENRLKSEAVAS